MVRTGKKTGTGKLLDAWVPDSDAGPALACLATSYTFDSVFFEEECLSRFAGVHSGTDEDDRIKEFIIEREERFSQIRAGVLVDGDHCRGTRSPRWDLLCARGDTGGILHAKISLLIWAKKIRLIVASANLTPQGYRKNREFFIVLNGAEGETLPFRAFMDALDYLDRLAFLGGTTLNPAVERWKSVTVVARNKVKELHEVCREPQCTVSFNGIYPRGSSLFDQLKGIWPANKEAIRDISFVSRFFDQDESSAEKVVKKIWELTSQTGMATLHAYLPAITDGDENIVIRAPKAFGAEYGPSRCIEIWAIDEIDSSIDERRPLHAKGILLESDKRSLMYIGSSNLSSAGSGIIKRSNWEAGISILETKENGIAKAFKQVWANLSAKMVEHYRFEGVADDPETIDESEDTPLPAFFSSAIYSREEGDAQIEFYFDLESSEETWSIYDLDHRLICKSFDWIHSGEQNPLLLPWEKEQVPSGFMVKWSKPGFDRTAWLPVCVRDQQDLPPPVELRALPLEVLIEILSAARPLCSIVASYLRRKAQGLSSGFDSKFDSLKKVDSSDFLIPRTRRVSVALRMLGERLAEPCISQEALWWRLKGPCGAKAVEAAILDQARGRVEEQCFFLAELCLELISIKPKEPEKATGYLKEEQVRKELRRYAKIIAARLATNIGELEGSMRDYVKKVIEKVDK